MDIIGRRNMFISFGSFKGKKTTPVLKITIHVYPYKTCPYIYFLILLPWNFQNVLGSRGQFVPLAVISRQVYWYSVTQHCCIGSGHVTTILQNTLACFSQVNFLLQCSRWMVNHRVYESSNCENTTNDSTDSGKKMHKRSSALCVLYHHRREFI